MGLRYGYNVYTGSPTISNRVYDLPRRVSKREYKKSLLKNNSSDTFTRSSSHKINCEKAAKKVLSFTLKALAFAGVTVVLKNSKWFNNMLKPVAEGFDKFVSKFSKSNKVAQNAGGKAQKSGIFTKIAGSVKSKISGLFKKH